MTDRPSPPLHPEIFEILLALAGGPLHGYGIVKAVAGNTGGEISLAPSLLYRRLRRLQDDGLVAEGEEAPGERGPPRKQYVLTPEGEGVLRAEARRIRELARAERVRLLFPREGT